MSLKSLANPDYTAIVNDTLNQLAKHEPTPELLAQVVDEIDGLLRGETKGEPITQNPDGFNQYENRVMGALRPQGGRLTRAQLAAVRDALSEAVDALTDQRDPIITTIDNRTTTQNDFLVNVLTALGVDIYVPQDKPWSEWMKEIDVSTVKKLDLRQWSLSGDVPPQLGELTALEVLDLGNNDITGGLEHLAGLTNLHTLRLSDNDLQGEWPAALSSLTGLRSLTICNNKGFTGGKAFRGVITHLHQQKGLVDFHGIDKEAEAELIDWITNPVDQSVLRWPHLYDLKHDKDTHKPKKGEIKKKLKKKKKNERDVFGLNSIGGPLIDPGIIA